MRITHDQQRDEERNKKTERETEHERGLKADGELYKRIRAAFGAPHARTG
jgi:hypothetical protein